MAKEKATISATLGHEYEDLEESVRTSSPTTLTPLKKWSSSNDSTLMS